MEAAPPRSEADKKSLSTAINPRACLTTHLESATDHAEVHPGEAH